jgi:hypothetical protein
MCKLRITAGQRLAIGSLINVGAADKQKCPTCTDHLRLQRPGTDGFAGHAGSHESLLRVGGVVYDQSHDMDGGRGITKVSGIDASPDQVLLSEQDVDKSGLHRLDHYMRYGIQAGFNCTSLGTIARLWREVLLEKPATICTAALDNPGRYKAAVYVSSLGNFFMTEIADVIVCGLREAGVDARRLSEKDAPLPGTTHHIVVAPHEFFVLGDGRKWATDEFVSRAVLFSTEQIQTQWFARSLVFLLRAKAVADMNQQTAAILRL